MRLNWNGRWRHSLATKLLVSVLCALVPIAGLLGLLWYDRRERDLDDSLRSLRQVAEAVAIIVDDTIDDAASLARMTADDPIIHRSDPIAVSATLRHLRRGDRFAASLEVFAADGRLVGSSAETIASSVLAGGVPPEVLQGAASSSEPVVFSVVNPDNPMAPVVAVVVAISGDHGSPVGFVAATLDSDAIDRHISHIRLLPGQVLGLIDSNARLVRFVNGVGMGPTNLTWEQRDRSRLPGVLEALQGETVATRSLQSELTPGERLAVFAPSPRYRWVVGASWPVSEALAGSHQAEQREFLIFFAIVLALLFSAALVARSIIGPLRRLADHAARFGDHNFAPRDIVRSDDEIGSLAQTLDCMGQQVRQTICELRDEQALLEAIIAQLPVGVVVVSATTKEIMRINDEAASYQPRKDGAAPRYDPSGSFGMYYLDGRPCAPEDRPIARVLRDALAVHGLEVVLRRPDQPDCYLRVNTGPVRDPTGRLLAVVQTFEDVTAARERDASLRERDASLRERDELLRGLFEQFPGALSVVDSDLRYLLAVGPRLLDDGSSPALSPGRIVGRRMADLYPPEYVRGVMERVKLVLLGETVTEEVTRHGRVYRRIDSPLRDAHGLISRVLTVRLDITEERRMEAELRERDDLLHTLFLQFPASITVVDRSFRLLMVGGKHLIRPDLTADELCRRSMHDLLSADELEAFRGLAERAFAGEAVTADRRVQGRVIRVTINPLRGSDGSIDRVMNVAFDVTEEVAQLERATRDEKLRALGQMAGGIAHDLNQALTLAAGYGELAREALDRTPVNVQEIREMIGIMERAAYDGGQTVRRLLTFSRVEANETIEPVDLATVLTEVERLTLPRWRNAPRADGIQISLRVDAEPGLLVSATSAGLREAITNLVFNAIDAMPQGGTITLAARRDHDRVLVDIRDTGVGMSHTVKERIFEPFFTTKGAAGSGLGMSMVFGIVERYGGQIAVTSEIGHGTTVHLSFPQLLSDTRLPSTVVASRPRDGLRVLVVDDDERIAKLAASLLQRDGYVVDLATSGEQALACLRSTSFDLVISDISMGDGMSGWDLAHEVGRLPRHVPVILATGWGAAISDEQARQRGVSGVIPKPYRRGNFQTIVARVLGQHSHRHHMSEAVE